MNHAHHYIVDLPVNGYSEGACKLCGHVRTFFDQIDGDRGGWVDPRRREFTVARARRSRKKNPRTQPPRTSCGKCGRSDFASTIGLTLHERLHCKGVAA